jgi:hypothetical protein
MLFVKLAGGIFSFRWFSRKTEAVKNYNQNAMRFGQKFALTEDFL